MGEIRNAVCLKDFITVYQVFQEEPFLENWEEDEIKKEYFSLLEKGALIFGYYKENNCIGIITMYPFIKGEHPITFKSTKVMYLSDIAVINEHRRHGIGSQLFDKCIEVSEEKGYELIYMRTNAPKGVSKSKGIALQKGFEETEHRQKISVMRTDGTIKTDERMFLVKKL